jgi:predicted amidophosphoribosyltransferase
MITNLSDDSEFWDWGLSFHELGLASTYKYKPGISASERKLILDELWLQVSSLNLPPIDAVLGVPPHLDSENSGPWEMARYFSQKLQIPDISWRISETMRLGLKIKNVPVGERADLLDGIYEFEIQGLGYAPSGILVLDDFYESGSTLESVCAYLKGKLPETKLAVMTMYKKRGG